MWILESDSLLESTGVLSVEPVSGAHIPETETIALVQKHNPHLKRDERVCSRAKYE